MGGFCSKSLGINLQDTFSNESVNESVYKADAFQSAGQISLVVPQVMVKDVQEPKPLQDVFSFREKEIQDDFYDGIPRLTRVSSQKVRSVRPTQAAVAKVTEVSALLGKAGTIGFGKAVDVLDTLGSSMTNLNNSGFASVTVTKGNELSILAFEVANTIVKGSNLMQSLSKRNIKHLKEVALHSEGVQNLVSKNIDDLLCIVAADKRQELRIFSGEVVRFGNRSKDPQWHNLQRYFDRISKELTPQEKLKEDAVLVIQQLIILVSYTAELYHEMQVLDRLEQDYKKRLGEDNSAAGAGHKGDSIGIIKAELKSQRKQVKSLKKKSLWSRSLEQVMEKFVDIVHFLLLELHNIFGGSGRQLRILDDQTTEKETSGSDQKLGPAGLALHYANIIVQIDSLVARSNSVTTNARDGLYANLPPTIKLSLRSKVKTFGHKQELTVPQIKEKMEKTLRWLVPVASNTTKAHHGFGWVGEWANTGAEFTISSGVGQGEILRIETLHHASKEKTEAYILEQVLWLQRLIAQSKIAAARGGASSLKILKTNPRAKAELVSSTPSCITIDEENMLKEASKKRGIRGISKSHDFDSDKMGVRKNDPLSKSSEYVRVRRSKSAVIRRFSSGIYRVDFFEIDKEKALDVIDRVDVPR